MLGKIVIIAVFIFVIAKRVYKKRNYDELCRRVADNTPFKMSERQKITNQDIIDYAFTFHGVLAVSLFHRFNTTVLFIKIAPMPSSSKKNIENSIHQYINLNFYPEVIHININKWENDAKRLGKYTTLEEYAHSLSSK